MQILDQAVAIIQKKAAQGGVNGPALAAHLEAIARDGEKAARLWQGYLDKPGAPGDKYTLVSWVGPEIAKQLHELSLEAHGHVMEVCKAAGDQARYLVLDESPITLAYRGLKEGETGTQLVQALLTEQQAMNKHLLGLADRLRAIKPSAAKPVKAAKKTAPKKPAKAKKPAAKKPAKAKKPTAPKKAKKAAKKK